MKRTEIMILEDLIANYQSQIDILKSIIESDEKIMAMQADIIKDYREHADAFKETLKSLQNG